MVALGILIPSDKVRVLARLSFSAVIYHLMVESGIPKWDAAFLFEFLSKKSLDLDYKFVYNVRGQRKEEDND